MIYFAALLMLLAYMFLPYWSIILIALIVGLLSTSKRRAFSSSFFAGLFVWGIISYYLDGLSQGVTGLRISALFGLPNVWLVYIVVGLLAGITMSSFALTGLYLRRTFFKNS